MISFWHLNIEKHREADAMKSFWQIKIKSDEFN